MATRTTKNPAGRNVVDAEVKSAYHDEILNWFIDHLAEVIAHYTGMGEIDEELVKARSKANQVFLQKVEDFLKKGIDKGEVSCYGDTLKMDDILRQAFTVALKRLPALRKAVEGFELDESTGDGVLTNYEVMKMVSRWQYKGKKFMPEIVKTPVGFVDLQAAVFNPSEFKFGIDGVTESEFGYIKVRQEDVHKFAAAVKPENLRIERLGQRVNYFISVRTDAFTLGEVLQELKELQQLEDGKHNVALAVDDIDEDKRAKILREGFFVFVRNDFQSS